MVINHKDSKIMNNQNLPVDFIYRNLLNQIINFGDEKTDRTGTGTKAIWCAEARFDIDKQFPIVSLKTTFWKTAIKELLWFLSGETNIRSLLESNVTIWSDWPFKRYKQSTEYDGIDIDEFNTRIVDDFSFASKWGEIGPAYGKQWRRWKGYNGEEIDQIEIIVNQLKNSPDSRRIILEGWNVADLDEMMSMSLPPCHKSYQYQVTSDGVLNSFLYQR